MKYSQPLWSYKQLIMKAETHMLSHLRGIPLYSKRENEQPNQWASNFNRKFKEKLL